MDAIDPYQIVAIRDRICSDFSEERWIDLGYITGCGDIIDSHPRLLRSLDFGDTDYPICALEVLQMICGRDQSNFSKIVMLLDRIAHTDSTPIPAQHQHPPTFPHGIQLHDQIGKGAMGTVYRASTPTHGIFALKYCHHRSPEQVRRFVREMQAATEIRHKNVLPIWSSNPDYDPPYYTMPLATPCTESLSSSMALHDILARFIEVLDGVAAIHNHGYIHRDIKPENILILADSSFAVADLGLAKNIVNAQSTLTQTGQSPGTNGHIAPELLAQEPGATTDIRVDIYSLGKTLYRLLSGRNPHTIKPDGIPPEIFRIIKKCTREEKSDRFQTIPALRHAVSTAKDALGPNAALPDIVKSGLAELIHATKVGSISMSGLATLLAHVAKLPPSSDTLVIDTITDIPIQYFLPIPANLAGQLVTALERMSTALTREYASYSWPHAEQVVGVMKSIWQQSEENEVRLASIEVCILASGILNRYAAQDSTFELLASVTDPKLALRIATLVENHREYSRKLLGRTDRDRLHPHILSAAP